MLLNFCLNVCFYFFFLLRWGQISEGFTIRLLWLLEKILELCGGENSQVALILFRTFRSTALPPQTLFFLKTRTWHETSAAIFQTSLRWGFFLLFWFFPLFINLKDAQINISHKHCTFIGQNKPSELHVSTFQVRWEEQHWSFFFLCLVISQKWCV